MTPFAERLASGQTMVADGAMGTMLLTRGLEPGNCPEALTLSRPKVLEEIARLYLEAGADIIETNTFGASPERLATYGLDQKTEELNEVAVRAVRKVVGDRAYVAGSCGPSGKLLEPHGDTSRDQLYRGFQRQAKSLVAAGVDSVFVETMIDLDEARLAVQAVKEVSPSTPVVATMTFESTRRGFYTVMGVSVEAAGSGLEAAGADAVGSNCGNGIQQMVEIARAFKESSDLPIVIQANAGLPQIVDGAVVYNETPDVTATAAKELIYLGVAVIGGCCGTTPEHTAAIRTMVDQYTS
ncbi:MAG: homocysteine S-methyltransferase family protein [Gemmatimonadales bacterium]|jgi:5-methyltetrahydrofolate--homocysteine methyltransferase